MMMSQQRSSLLWQYAKRRPLVVTFAVACRCVWEVIPLTLPLLAGGLVNRLAETSSRSDPGGLPSVALIARSASVEGLIAALFGVAVLAGVLAIFKSLSMAHMGRGLVSYARRELSLAMLEADWGDTKRRSAGSWLTLLNSDCGHLRGLLERVFVRGVTSVLRFVGPLIGMLALSWEMAIGTLAVWPLAVVVIVYLHRAIRSAARAQSEAKDRYTHLVKETIDGAETIRGMGAERSWQRRLGDAIEAVEACQLRGATYSAGLQSVVWFTAIACLGVSWWMGAQRVTAGSMTVGGLVAFTGLLELAQRPIRSYTRIAQRFQRTTVSEERLRAAFDSLDVGRDSLCPETAKPNPSRNLVQSPAEPPAVRLESVKLTRGDRVLFDRFDHEFPAGKLTVLAGPSGVGKSSLLRMIGGLVSPDSGGILFRSVGPLDRSVNAAGSPAALEERERADDPRPPDDSRVRYPDFLVKTDSPVKTVFVPQQPWVLSGTLADNVRFGGGDPSPERLAWAAETSGVEKLVRDLPLGWETWIGDGVTELSGGQIQRVALCRALLREPTVLLLDEPTSALDVTAEAELLERLRGLRGRVTVILSAHRDACLREAEEVLWLPSGEDTARPVMKPGSGTVRENRSESARLREVPRGDSAKEAHHVASA